MGKDEEQQEQRGFLDPFRKLRQVILRTKSLPPYTKQDVEEFIRSDPVHGPQLEKMNQAADFCYAGAVLVGLGTAVVSYRFNKNVPGALLAVACGGMVGLKLGEEVANLSLGLYKFPRLEPRAKFLDWWENQQS